MKISRINVLRNLCTIPLFLIVFSAKSQQISSSYEIRCFANNENANGETDFNGETAVFSTDERIDFLNYYANEVSAYHRDKELNTEVAPDVEVESLMTSIRPQPLPEVRNRIMLDEWKWLSAYPGQHESSLWEIHKYFGAENMQITEGALAYSGEATWEWKFAIQTWRFSMSWKLRLPDSNCQAEFLLQNNATGRAFTKFSIEGGKLSYYSMGHKAGDISLKMDEWHQIKIEANLDKEDNKQHYNLYIDGHLAGDFLIANDEVMQVNVFECKAGGNLEIDDLFGVGYHRTTSTRHPYYPNTFIDENFDIKPEIKGWESRTYDDSSWPTASLPIGQGSERHKGEDLYFRKTIKLNDFNRAYLNIETLDPGGEIWVNGKMAALIKDRYPIRLDISKYLKSNSENLITLKVNSFYLNPAEGKVSPHSPLDYNANWFAGRTWLDLTGETFVQDAFFYTKSLEYGNAEVQTLVNLEHKGTLGFKGKVRIKTALWNDEDEHLIQVAEMPVLISPGNNQIRVEFTLNKPKLWEPASPNLYKVVVQVEDKDVEIIDDYVFTTGIRTISQKGGTFNLNDKPAMLNGAQIMGFRAPLENMMAWTRCPPEEWVAKEMLMTQKMNCNMLRIHVHGWKEKAVGINDPRYAEYADQMGIMLISNTPAWIREGDWGQVDFDGYHKYMKQTQNHPSIVMWEVSNHPNTFSKNPEYESDLFCEKAYKSIFPYDPSRLISISSHIGHMIYGNDKGTLDKGGRNLSNPDKQVVLSDPGNQIGLNLELFSDTMNGDEIQATKAWTAPMVTRGNQDALTGYGAQWSVLRKWPGAYHKEFLDSEERAYFNFEHQESIGQPNWNLSKGKPWYHLQSYEWGYDEGSIGRKLGQDEWRESQAWQAFSAYEATKKMRMLDYDGFSWCTLHGGANTVTYKKPAIDFLGYGKLVFHVHKTLFQPILAGSNNVDVVYGPGDSITPMVLNLGEAKKVKLSVVVRDKFEGKVIDRKVYKNVSLESGRTVIELEAFKPNIKDEGFYFIEYLVNKE